MNYDAMISFATQLAETVSAAKSTAEELAHAREEMAALQRKLDSLAADRDGLAARLEHSQESCARLAHERDEVAFQHLEASEALAEANAKLNSFRKLLGMDGREAAAGAVPATSTDPVAAPVPATEPLPASVGEPVVPEAAPGAGGVEQDHAAAVTPQVNQTAYEFVTSEPASTQHVPAPSSSEPAPEVAESRPTPSTSSEPSSPESTGMTTSVGAEVPAKPEGGPISWRNSPAYVPFSG